VYVLLDLDTEVSGEASGKQSDVDPVHQMLREQNELLREQLAEAHAANHENRRIITALTQRIPELEPPRDISPEPPQSPVASSEERGNVTYHRSRKSAPGGRGGSEGSSERLLIAAKRLLWYVTSSLLAF
jgi:hypothetical protein